MSVHTTAQLIYVHFHDRFGIYLFDLHVKGILPGPPIPQQYTVHGVPTIDANKHSVNLAITNGGSLVDTSVLTEHINKLKIFGSVTIGVYGITEIPYKAAA